MSANLPPTDPTDSENDSYSSHRRRHSLPPSAKLSSILNFWSHNSSSDSLRITGERQPRPRSQASNGIKTGKRSRRNSRSQLSNNVTNGNTSNNNVKPVVSQPVLVRAYSPRPESAITTAIPELDETERIELPPVDAFSFTGILKAIDPKVNRTIETITQLSTNYRSNLTHETELIVSYQKDIESQILTADRLSSQVLKTTTTRSDRLKSESAFRNGVAVEELAVAAENAYSTIESIIAKLEAIDEMLPPQDRLGTVDSPHKRHYPYTHSLLAAKTADSRRLSQLQPSNGISVSSPLSPRMTTTNSFSSSHTQVHDTGSTSWMRRRQGSQSGLSAGPLNLPYLSPNGPPMSPEERRLSSPPALVLRTVHPSASVTRAGEVAVPQVSSPSPYHVRRQSAIITNIPIRERDSLSVQSNAGQSTRSSFSFKNLLWGGGWRRAGSNASVGGSSIAGSETSETAEEKLRRIIQEQTRRRLEGGDTGKGKGKGVMLSSSLPM
ncbi:hypothetical protein ABW19_dt0201401 [Dactylella cylindrospora]|nr:hypothetical protein ABW19_dt0201401 [Dactylella cylindrospora]